MIEKLTIKGFQCHRDLTVEFKDCTVFVGQNGSGKSAILRALAWVALNQWDGKAGDFISHGQDTCECELTIDGRVITRRLSSNENAYSIDGDDLKPGGRGKVPDTISEIVNLGEDNFQSHGDSPFWVGLTSGQAASALNEIFNLSQIDDALGKVSSEVRQARSRVAVTKERLIQAREERDKLKWVKESEAKLLEMEAVAGRLEETYSQYAQLERRFTLLEECGDIEKDLRECLNLAQVTLVAMERSLEIEKRIDTIKQRISLIREEKHLAKSLKVSENKLKELLSGACPLCGATP